MTKARLTIISFIMIAFLAAASLLLLKPSSFSVDAANIKDNAIMIMSGQTQDDKVLIDARITQNSGVSGMQLELVYDTSAMELEDFVRGGALASLSLEHTNINTDKGYAITPFKFNFLGSKNDSTTGLLLRLTFKIKEGTPNGVYNVNLKAERNKDVIYLEDNGNGTMITKTKNVLVDSANVEIKDSKPVQVQTVSSSTWWIYVLVGVGIIIISAAIFMYFYKLKGRGWKHI